MAQLLVISIERHGPKIGPEITRQTALIIGSVRLMGQKRYGGIWPLRLVILNILI